MYRLPNTRPEAEVEPGTSLLLAGGDGAAVREFGAECLRRGAADGEGVVAVLTGDAAVPDGIDGAGPVGVVDCRPEGSVPDGAVVRTPDPGDLAAAGVAVSELLATFREGRGSDRNRVLVVTADGVVAAADREQAFQFLHVLSARIRSASALGLVALTGADGATSGALRPAFDGFVTVAGDGTAEYAPTRADSR